MATATSRVFFQTLSRILWPSLEARGFAKLGSRDWSRVVDGVVQAVNFQPSKYGGECFVNLGLHPVCVPLEVHALGFDPVPDPGAVKALWCALRLRFEPAAHPEGPWPYARPHLLELDDVPEIRFDEVPLRSWRYRTARRDGPEPDGAARTLAADFEAHVFAFFERYRSLASIVADTPLAAIEQLERCDAQHIPWPQPAPRLALVMARVELARGDRASAHDYARFGLEHVGRATALEPMLTRLLELTMGAPPTAPAPGPVRSSLWRLFRR